MFIISVVIIIALYGLIALYSADGGDIRPYANKQAAVFVTFFLVSFAVATLDIRLIFKITPLLYVLTLFLLVVVEFRGRAIMGASRWLDLYFFKLQPSELSKISIILLFARYFHVKSKNNEFFTFKDAVKVLTLVSLHLLLILKQPDFGTAMILLLITAFMFFAFGTNIKNFLFLGVTVIILAPLVWSGMHEYQRKRIAIFLDQDQDIMGAGYNVAQSKIALGSGGLFGKGFLQGTQSHLKFLPEYQTDFIYALISEELGFVGGFILIFLYMLLILALLLRSLRHEHIFTRMIMIGISNLIFAHVFINISMVIGLLPVVGIPLPLISYGGTMTASTMICIGLVMNMEINRYTKF